MHDNLRRAGKLLRHLPSFSSLATLHTKHPVSHVYQAANIQLTALDSLQFDTNVLAAAPFWFRCIHRGTYQNPLASAAWLFTYVMDSAAPAVLRLSKQCSLSCHAFSVLDQSLQAYTAAL